MIWIEQGGERFRAVSMRPSLTFDARRAASLVGLAVPSAGPAEIRVLRDGEPIASVMVARPTPLSFELPGSGAFTLEADDGLFLVHPRLQSRHHRPRRVVLLICDTLRADAISPETTPEILEVFRGGARWRNAFSQATWTLPSMASLFTGLLPTRLRDQEGTLISLPEARTTLAERMRSKGYATLGLTANFTVNHVNGFSQGFDFFWAPALDGSANMPDVAEMSRRARDALKLFADRDVFMWVQFMDTHDPYRNHETGESLTPPALADDLDPDRLAALRDAYNSEVRHLSRGIGTLVEALGELDTLVLTADHGEGFGENGSLKHGATVFPEASRVPLLIKSRGLDGIESDRPTSLLALYSFLSEGSTDALLAAGAPTTVETFAHDTPRWATVVQGEQWVVASSLLPAGAPSDPIEAWLRERHPRLSVVRLADPPGSVLEVATPRHPELLEDRHLLLLAHQYHGFRPGIWLFARERGGTLEIPRSADSKDDGDSIVCWTGCGYLSLTTEGTVSRLEIAHSRVPIMIFIPRPSGRTPTPYEAEVPASLPDAGWARWSDPGRPQEELRGIRQTLERLEALGYIGG